MLKFWSEKSGRKDYLGDAGWGGRIGLVLGSYTICSRECVGAVSGGRIGSVSANTFTFSKSYNFLTSKGNVSSEVRLFYRIRYVIDPYVICEAIHQYVPVPVAARSKAQVCGRSPAGIVGSNPTGDMDVCLLWVLSGRSLCDGLITRPEVFYRLWCVVECDLENSRMRGPWPTGGCCAPQKICPYVICYGMDPCLITEYVGLFFLKKYLLRSKHVQHVQVI